ncbi:hypothetical protein HDU85_002244 [Gaertneriomyces sp. JEL0708]|nr:hypothetical protein HDU85_002244 [Gaertneriomyces sp. JEL0708]
MILSRSIQIAVLGAAWLTASAQGQVACDPSTCKLPACKCPSTQAPIANPPQFLLLTFDDSIQAATWQQSQSLVNRKNPNGCSVKATWYTQVLYSDPYLVTQWYAQGHEVADHGVTHKTPEAGEYEELEGMRKWANEYAGIPLGKISGVRYPYLKYSKNGLEQLAKMKFEYDSSIAAAGEMWWPYTLDNGVVHNCNGEINLCNAGVKAPGLWEIPMYPINRPDGAISLMDPYNDPVVTDPISPADVTASYRATFDKHYATRTPFGVYTHPVWLGKAQPPSIPDGGAKLKAVEDFLDYALSRPDTWMVTGSQLIQWMKNPVPADQLASQPYMSCTPTPAPPANICNGLAGGQPELCSLPDGAFSSCYGCPQAYPTLQNPSPPSSATARCKVPTTCDTLYWDPVGCKCLCEADSCKYTDSARPVNLDPKSLDQPQKGNNTDTNAPDQKDDKSGAAKAVDQLGTVLLGLGAAVVAGGW